MLDNVLNCFTIIYDPSFEKIKSCKFLFILTMNLTMASTFDNILLTKIYFIKILQIFRKNLIIKISNVPVIVTNIQLVAQSDNFKADTDE